MDDRGHPFPKDIVEGLCGLGVVMGTVSASTRVMEYITLCTGFVLKPVS